MKSMNRYLAFAFLLVACMGFYFFSQSHQATQWYEKALATFEAGDFITSEIYAARSLDYRSRDEVAAFHKRCRAMILKDEAESLIQQGFYLRAHELAVEATSILDDQALLAWQDGIALLVDQKNDEEAQKRQDEQNKKQHESWVLKAMRFESEGKFDEAEQAYGQASKFSANKIEFEANRHRVVRKRVESLIELLSSPDRRLREEAKSELLDIGDPAFHLLAEAFKGGYNLPDDIYASLKEETHDRIVEAVTRRIASEDPKVRSAVAWVLGRLKDPRSTQQVLGLLNDPDPQVQVAALEALAAIGEPFNQTAWTEKLKIEDIEFRRQIASVLRRHPTESSRNFLMELASEGSYDLQEVTLWALGGDRHPETRQFLKEKVSSLADDRLKAQALLSLASAAHVGDEEMIINQLDQVDPESRSYFACVRGLGFYDDPISSAVLNRLLKDSRDDVRAEALKQLLPRPSDANFKRVLRLLEDEGQPFGVHLAALSLLTKKPELAPPHLMKLYAIHDNRDLRLQLTKILERQNSLDSIHIALSLTQDTDPFVRRGASMALLAHRAEEGVIAVVPRLLASKNLLRIEEGLRLAGEFKEEEFVPLMTPFVNHESTALRIRAQVALSQMKLNEWKENLKTLSLEGTFHEKKYLAKILGESKEPLHFEVLLSLLDDADAIVREAAVGSIATFGDPRSIEPLLHMLQDDVQAVRGLALWALSRFGPRDNRVSAALLKILQDRNSRVRMGAAILLGELGDRRAVNYLISGLKESSYELRLSCALALGKLGSLLGVPALIDELRQANSQRRKEIIRALHTITGHTSAQTVEEWEAWWAKNS